MDKNKEYCENCSVANNIYASIIAKKIVETFSLDEITEITLFLRLLMNNLDYIVACNKLTKK